VLFLAEIAFGSVHLSFMAQSLNPKSRSLPLPDWRSGLPEDLLESIGQRLGQDLLLRDAVEADTVRVGVEREQQEQPEGREWDGGAPWGTSGSEGCRVVA